MFYNLFKYLESAYDLPGTGMFQYISFRAAIANVLALLIVILCGGPLIKFLRRRSIGETVRELGLEGQKEKEGTPTMGGILIILAIVLPTLLLARLDNVYILLLLVSTIWCGFIGLCDDYIKVFRHNKDGIKPRTKIIGQVGLGLIVGVTMCFADSVVMRENGITARSDKTVVEVIDGQSSSDVDIMSTPVDEHCLKTTIPFLKNNEFDYNWLSFGHEWLSWLIYIFMAILIVTAVSNSANLTDGLDGLLSGVAIPPVAVLGILAYLSGHVVYASYLNIMYIPDSGELFVFAAAMIGAMLGFMWYNANPAQIFMGDTGSLAIGGIVAVLALCIRKELLLPIMCGVFMVEGLSSFLQMGFYKLSRKMWGTPKRIFLKAPLHHHYQEKHIKENKVTVRFIIVSLMLAAISLATLKIR